MGTLSLSPDSIAGSPAIRIDAGPNLDMQRAETLAGLLHEAVADAKPLIVDASEVERMSTSAVQLLLAADRDLAEADMPLVIRRPSAAFVAALADCGVRPADVRWTVEDGDD